MISLTKKKRCRPGLLGIEKLGIIYAAFTAVVAAVFYNYIPSIGEMAITRVGYAAGMAALILIYRKRPCHLTFFLRIALQLGMLATWYPETYLFCSIFGNLDHVFAQADITRQNMERAFQYGIFFILSHDFLPRGMDILPPISVVRKNIFHNPLLILHLLRDIHVPARSGTAILLSGSGN